MVFEPSKFITGGTLKSYQLDGQNWLIQRYIFAMHGAIVSLRLVTEGGILVLILRVHPSNQLADEMGTGKTLQSISLLAFIYEQIHKPDTPSTDRASLVILPKAVLYNWAAELER